jgi:outer membrane receptor protein involved in Fe transport
MGRLLLLLAAIEWATMCAWAQSPLATVTGLAKDPSGAAVPGATVKLTNEATGVERQLSTNEAGAYTFANIQPGRYRLEASAKGFRDLAVTALEAAAYRTVRQDLPFTVSDVGTQVSVTASGAIVTETPSVAVSLNARQLLELPTNLRSVYNNSGDSGLMAQIMPLTIPGVLQVGAGAAWITPGAGANSVKVKVDGIETNFGNFGTADPVSQPSMESVEEFTANIMTNRAEFGGMGAITSVTKSGNNGLHGGIFWFGRNSALDARNTFSTAKPFQNIHNYGGTLSGPVKKDKTFFYVNFDGIRGSRAYLFSPNVPTLAMRDGDFTGAAALRNPFPGQNPFQGNRILPQFLSPQALRAQEQFFPLPNFGAANLTAANYRAAFNGPEEHRIFEVRLDHNWSSKHQSFARYQYKNSDYMIPGARTALPPQSVGTSSNWRTVNFFTLGDVLNLSPTLVNEFRAGGLALGSKSDADLRGQTALTRLGITGLPDRTGIRGLPVITITGLSATGQSLLNPVNDGHWQVSDNLTWVKGRHTIKTGFEVVHWFVNRYLTTAAGLFGAYDFTPRYTGNAYADFLLGLPTTVTRLDPFPVQYNRWTDYAFYIQDDWKVSSRLTLSYGLRYEYNQPVTARDGNIYSFDPKSGRVIIPDNNARRLFSPAFPATVPIITADSVGLPASLRKADKNNWAPRFGLSYQLNPKTVIRAGWGTYWAHYSGVIAAALASGPYALTSTINNPPAAPAYTLANPFGSPSAPGTINLNGIAGDLRNSYAMQYTLTVERELLRDLGVRVSYIGSKASQLPYQRNLNQPVASTTPFTAARRPYPLYNNVIFAENGANSLYSGLQVQVNKRFSQGLSFSSAWTWAKQLSDVDDTGSAELNTTIENSYDRRRDRANSYSVPRHQWMNQILHELPFFKAPGLAQKVLGGWQTNVLINASTGNFLTPVFAGSDPSGTNTIGGRPDVAATVGYSKSLTNWFDRTAFTVPPTGSGRFGNAARNSIVGPGYVIFNFGVMKNIKMERAGNVQLGASFQNLLNHVNYGQPNMTVNNVNGGVITSTHIFPPAGSARTGQLSLRWMF